MTRTMEELLELDAPAWRPDDSDAGHPPMLVGQLVDRAEIDSEYSDEPYSALTIETDAGGVYTWHGFHTSSRMAIKKWNPQIGERVGVVYKGLGEAKIGQNAPVIFRLRVDREPGATPPAIATPVESGPDGTNPPLGSGQQDDVPF
jgi:hypothetical protein